MTKWDLFRLIAGWLAPAGWDRPAEKADPLPAWERIIEASSGKLVTPMLAWRLRDAPWVDKEAAEYLSAVLDLNRRRNGLQLDALAVALDGLGTAGVTPILLKGADMLAADLYPDPGCRFVGDLDLLFRPDELEAACAALRAAGFHPVGPALASDSHQLQPHVHDRLKVGIDVHRYPLRQHLQPILDTRAAFADAEPILVRNRAALRLAPTHRAIVSIAHGQIVDGLGRVGIPELRRLLDLTVLHRTDAIDWPALAARFAAAGYGPLLAEVLGMARHLLAMAPPPGMAVGDEKGVRRVARTVNRSLPVRILSSLRASLPLVPGLFAMSPAALVRTFGWRAWRQRLRWFSPKW